MAVQMSTSTQDFAAFLSPAAAPAEVMPEGASQTPEKSFLEVLGSAAETVSMETTKVALPASANRSLSAEGKEARLRLLLGMAEGLQTAVAAGEISEPRDAVLAGLRGLNELDDLSDLVDQAGLRELAELAKKIGKMLSQRESGAKPNGRSRFDPDLILGSDSPETDEVSPEEAAETSDVQAPEVPLIIIPEDSTNTTDAQTDDMTASTTVPQTNDAVTQTTPPQTEGAADELEPLIDSPEPTEESAGDKPNSTDLPKAETGATLSPEATAVSVQTTEKGPQAERDTRRAAVEPERLAPESVVVANPEDEAAEAKSNIVRENADAPEKTPEKPFEKNDRNDPENKNPFAGQDETNQPEANLQGRRRPGASKAANVQTAQDTATGATNANRTQPQGTVSFAAELQTATQRSGAAETSGELTPRLDTPQILNRQNPFGDGVTNVLEFLRNEGTSEARIVVEPPALGRIDVSLQASNNGVEAAFKVDSENLKQVLQQQLDSLKSSLEAQGIHVSGLTVDIRNKEDQKGRADVGQGGKKSRRISGAEATEEDLEEGKHLVRLDLEKGLLHWIA